MLGVRSLCVSSEVVWVLGFIVIESLFPLLKLFWIIYFFPVIINDHVSTVNYNVDGDWTKNGTHNLVSTVLLWKIAFTLFMLLKY